MTLLRWLAFLLGSQTVILPALLDLFIYCDASIFSTVAFHTLGYSDHVVISVSIDDFPSNSQQEFHNRFIA